MKKKVLCLVMAMVMVVGAGISVQAEDHQGSDGWVANFDGKEIKSNFDSSDIADATANVEPGDSITLKVGIKNSDSGKTDWYMTNEAIQSLEDANSVANGGAYEYRLAYINAAGKETELYNSETVGGEGASTKEGLHQATDSLEEYFYLDRLNPGQSGMVTLRVKIDGETVINDYQETLALLKMTFAVEKVTESTIRKIPGEDKVITNRVKTGDTNKILLFCALALISGIILLILGLMSMKRRRYNRKGE